MPSKTTSKSTKSSAVDNKISKKEEDGSHVSVTLVMEERKKSKTWRLKMHSLYFIRSGMSLSRKLE